MAIEGWIPADIAIGIVLGVLVGVVYMLVRITTGNGRKKE